MEAGRRPDSSAWRAPARAFAAQSEAGAWPSQYLLQQLNCVCVARVAFESAPAAVARDNAAYTFGDRLAFCPFPAPPPRSARFAGGGIGAQRDSLFTKSQYQRNQTEPAGRKTAPRPKGRNHQTHPPG